MDEKMEKLAFMQAFGAWVEVHMSEDWTNEKLVDYSRLTI